MRTSNLILCLLLLSPAAHAAQAKAPKPTTQIPAGHPSIAEDDDDEDEDEDAPAAMAAKDGDDEEEDEDDTPDPHQVTGNIAFTTDFLDRGLTLSNHKPALQGGFEWEHPAGPFLGAWASSVSLPDVNASLLGDFHAGYAFSLGGEFEESLSVHYGTLFSDQSRNDWTFESETKWRDFSFTAGYIPSYRESGFSLTATAGWAREVNWGIRVGLYADYTFYANQSLSASAATTAVDSQGEEVEHQVLVYEATPNYFDARATVGHEFLGVLWQLEGVVLKKQTIEGILAGPRIAASVSKEF